MSKTNIRVGDVVQYVRQEEFIDNQGGLITGMIGTVVLIDRDESWPIEVDFHNVDGINYPMSTSELVLVTVAEDH